MNVVGLPTRRGVISDIWQNEIGVNSDLCFGALLRYAKGLGLVANTNARTGKSSTEGMWVPLLSFRPKARSAVAEKSKAERFLDYGASPLRSK